MALSWILRQPAVTSALIGASRPEQITENVEAVNRLDFTAEELAAIELTEALRFRQESRYGKQYFLPVL